MLTSLYFLFVLQIVGLPFFYLFLQKVYLSLLFVCCYRMLTSRRPYLESETSGCTWFRPWVSTGSSTTRWYSTSRTQGSSRLQCQCGTYIVADVQSWTLTSDPGIFLPVKVTQWRHLSCIYTCLMLVPDVWQHSLYLIVTFYACQLYCKIEHPMIYIVHMLQFVDLMSFFLGMVTNLWSMQLLVLGCWRWAVLACCLFM